MTLTDALYLLEQRGRIRASLLPGMLLSAGNACEYRSPRVDETRRIHKRDIIDLTDPATRGILLELLREASGDPSIVTDPHTDDGRTVTGWTTFGMGPAQGPEWDGPWARTEGEAIAQALIALAGGA